MPKKLINPTKNSLARAKRMSKKAVPKKVVVQDIPLSASDGEYQARAAELNARLECVKCGRNIEGRSKAHFALMNYEKTVCIPCFEEAVFGRKGRR